jgi:tetratricopeptide (TPR) repeat protein
VLDDLIAPVLKDTELVDSISKYKDDKVLAFEILSGLHEAVFTEDTVEFPDGQHVNTLSDALTIDPNTKKLPFDCDTSSFVYLEIFEKINKDLPVVLLHCPRHALIKWKFSDGSYMDWETSSGFPVLGKKEYYENNCKEVIQGSDAFYSLFYYNRGIAKYSLKDYAGAIKDYDKSIELNPKDVSVYKARGLAKYEFNDYAGAIKDYDKALELNPKDMYIYGARGAAKYELKDYAGAIADYDKMLELDPKEAALYYNRGNAKYNLKDYAGAVEDYDKAVELDPKDTDAQHDLKIAKDKLKEFSVGKKELEFFSPNKTHSIKVTLNNGKIENISNITLGKGYKGTEKITKISADGKSFIFTTATGVKYKITPDLTALTYDTVKLAEKVK